MVTVGDKTKLSHFRHIIHFCSILSGSYDSTVRLWSVKDSYYPIMTIPGHSGAVKCVRWIEHGK